MSHWKQQRQKNEVIKLVTCTAVFCCCKQKKKKLFLGTHSRCHLTDLTGTCRWKQLTELLKFSSSPSMPWCTLSHQRTADCISGNWRQIWWKAWALLVAANPTDRLLLGLLNFKQEQLEKPGSWSCLSPAAILCVEQGDKAHLCSLRYHTAPITKRDKNYIACISCCYTCSGRKRSYLKPKYKWGQRET